jgi:hypothetical protein
MTTRYKPLFSVSASYQQPDMTISAIGLRLNVIPISQTKMNDLSLLCLDKENTSTVYYKGLEMPVAAPLTSEPYNEIDTLEPFYFGLDFMDKALIQTLKFHSTAAIAKSISFPLLYDAAINVLNGPAVFTKREDVKVGSPVFTFTANAVATGIAGNWAAVEITDENNTIIDMKNNLAPLNDKQIDGINAVPEFAFSLDLSSQPAGVYKVKVGNVQQLFFIPNGIVIDSQTIVIRVVKNSNLTYHTTLADTAFAQFNLTIPKA